MLKKLLKKVKYSSKYFLAFIMTLFYVFLDDDSDEQKSIQRRTNELLEKQELEKLHKKLYKKVLKYLKEEPKSLKEYEKNLQGFLKEMPEDETFRPLRKKVRERLDEINDIKNLKEHKLEKEKIVKTESQYEKPSFKKIDEKPLIKKEDNYNLEKVFASSKVASLPLLLKINKPVVNKNLADKIGSGLNVVSKPDAKMEKMYVEKHIPLDRPKVRDAMTSIPVPLFMLVKEKPKAILNPKIVPKTKYKDFQVLLNDATSISKEINQDIEVSKKEATNKNMKVIKRVNEILNKKTNSKTKMLPFKLFQRKIVQELFSASILNHKLVSSINLLNQTDFDYQKVPFLTLLSKKKTKQSLEKTTLKNIKALQVLKVSIKNKYFDKLDTPEVIKLMEKIDKMEEELSKKYEEMVKKNPPKVKKRIFLSGKII